MLAHPAGLGMNSQGTVRGPGIPAAAGPGAPRPPASPRPAGLAPVIGHRWGVLQHGVEIIPHDF